MMSVFIKSYCLQTVGTIINMNHHMVSFICCLATANDKNTIISTKFEICCYFGEISSQQHVFTFSKELILLFMEDF